MKSNRLWIIILLVFFLGCSSFLYQPSRHQFADPSKIGATTPQSFLFSSLDGTSLHGWYFVNKKKIKPKGLIIFFHGNAENITTHFSTLYWILDHGYDYFIFDYRGYGESLGMPTPKKTMEDGIAAIRWAHKHNPSAPLIIFGQSLGGAVALRSVVELKNEIPIALVAVDSTFHSYRSAAKSVAAQHWLTWLFQPFVYLAMNDRYAPKSYIADISPVPLVVFHGDRDQTISYKLGLKVYRLAREPKEFIKVANGRHADLFFRHKDEYREAFLKRLSEYSQPQQKK